MPGTFPGREGGRDVCEQEQFVLSCSGHTEQGAWHSLPLCCAASELCQPAEAVKGVLPYSVKPHGVIKHGLH